MIVNCEGCETGFSVDERMLKPGGSKVRCSKCRHVFVVYPPPLDDSEEPLDLNDEMTAVESGAADADMASIAAKLDEIFDDAPVSNPVPAAEESEILDAADLLAEDAAAPAEAAAEKGELDFDLDLGLEAGGEAAAGSASPGAGGAPAEEEIEFNLEPAPADQPAEAAGSSAEEISLDLINELNLDLDAAPDATTTTLSKNAKKANPLAKTDQIDLEDLENLLDDLEPPAAEPVAAELDLDLRPEPPQEKAAEEIQDIQLVLDDAALAAEAVAAPQEPMLDIEALLSDDAGTTADARPQTEGAAQKQPAASTDLEIEFEPVEEGARPAATAAAAVGAAAAAAMAGDDDVSTQESGLARGREATDVLDVEPAEKPAPVKKAAAAVPRRSGGGILKPLLAVVVVVLVAMAAFVVPRTLGLHIPYLTDTEIPVLSDIDLELPYIGHVGKLFKAEAPDPDGWLKILPDAGSVTAQYVDNALTGRLLVIKGKVRNAYDHPRSAIRVSATVFGKGGAAVKSATVYAGGMLTEDELATLNMEAIHSRLSHAGSAAKRPLVAKPGASLPFMAVFSGLPAAIEEYSVEVAGSKP